MGAVTMRRCGIGRDVIALHRSNDGITLEGRLRLRPGTLVEIVEADRRVAFVETWAVARLGQSGPIFRGFCRWRPGAGSHLTHDAVQAVGAGAGSGHS